VSIRTLPDGAIARLGTLRLVHLGELSAVAISRDGKVVASGVRTGKSVYLGEKTILEKDDFSVVQGERVTQATIRLWDADTGKRIREIVTPDAPVSALHFDQAGRILYAGCGKYLCFFEAATGKKLWQTEAVKGAKFERDLETQQIVLAKDKLITIHHGQLSCYVFKNRGTSYYRHSQHVVLFWDSKTGKPLPVPESLQSSIQAETRIPVLFHEVAVSANGRFAAIQVTRQAEPLPEENKGYPDDNWKYKGRTLQIIDLDSGKVVHSIADAKDILSRVTQAEDRNSWRILKNWRFTFAEDGQTLAIAADNDLGLLQMNDGKRMSLATPKDAWVSQMTFIDKSLLAAKLSDDSIHIWDSTSGKPVEKHTISERHFESARTGSRVATRDFDTIAILDLYSGKPLHAFSGHRMTPAIRYATHSKDTLVSCDLGSANYWNAKDWSLRSRLTLRGELSRYWDYYLDILTF
jgi:WD40 repeat protein